jgi:microcystin-dependent protein
MPNLTKLEELLESGEVEKTISLSPMTVNLCLALLDRYAEGSAWFTSDETNWRLDSMERDRAEGYQAKAMAELMAEGVQMAYIGEIRMFGVDADNLPPGWLHCNGQGLDPDDYPDLFAAIGYTFGNYGDLFALPIFVHRSPQGYSVLEQDNEPMGAQVGTLMQTQVPQHHHAIYRESATPAQTTVKVGTGQITMNTLDTGEANGVDQRGPRLCVCFAIYAGA